VIIERTYDIEEINYVLKHPNVKGFIEDDFSQDVEYPMLDIVYYLAARENDIIAGMFVVLPINGVTVDAHSAMLPGFYGDKAREAGRLAIRWVFESTGFLKINGSTPDYNKRALRFSEDIGFKREGINKKSYMKNGKLYDQIYFGVEREEWQ
jgi:hypothetical protein